MFKIRFISMLVLLAAVVTGAWAEAETYSVKFEANGNSKTIENVTLPKTWACNWNSENGELDLIIKELYQLSKGYSSTSPNTSVTGGNGKVTVVSSKDQSITISEPFEGTATVEGMYKNNNIGEDFSYSLTISIPGYVAPATVAVTDVTASDITGASATVSWNGTGDSYNLRYRKMYLSEGFESCSHGELPAGWTALDADGDGHSWFAYDYSEQPDDDPNPDSFDSMSVESASYDNGALTPDNWLISPQVPLKGKLSLWAKGVDPDYAAEHFAIYLSTTGKDVADFTTVLIAETEAQDVFTEYTADLSAYAGQVGYIAIRHFNVTDEFVLAVDNITITDDWVEADGVTSPYTLDGLDGLSIYEVEVQAVTGEQQSSWSTLRFNTLPSNATITYDLTLADGTEDATNWQGKAGEGDYQSLPLEGVAAGTAVSLKYGGALKVKSVKAKKKAAAAPAAAEATAEDIGKLIGADGNIYDDAAAATAASTTAVAMIAYVGSETGVDGYTHGLALALTDEASVMNWATATGASGAAAHTPAAPTTTSSWMLPSKDQWNKMIDACKNVLGTKNNYQDLRDGFSGITGASNLQSDYYWSSTEYDSSDAWDYYFDEGNWMHSDKSIEDHVRACLAF